MATVRLEGHKRKRLNTENTEKSGERHVRRKRAFSGFLGDLCVKFFPDAPSRTYTLLSDVGPIQDDLPSFARAHGFETLLILAPGKAVRNDRGNVQAGFDHDGHLVPGLKHFTAVN